MGPDGSIYAGVDDGRIVALTGQGAVKWVVAAQDAVRSALAVGADGTVYAAATDGKLYAIMPDGRIRWVHPTGGPIVSAPVLDRDQVAYFGSQDDHLYAIDATGQLRWSIELPADVDASVALTDAGTLIVASDDGFLRAFR
jgi:outer membrane protein assembly factor BamB